MFLMSRSLENVLLVFLNSFLQKLPCDVYAFLSEKVFDFKNFFLSLDLLIKALYSSLVITGASFARIYFLLIGAYLLKLQKIVYLKPPRSEAANTV